MPALCCTWRKWAQWGAGGQSSNQMHYSSSGARVLHETIWTSQNPVSSLATHLISSLYLQLNSVCPGVPTQHGAVGLNTQTCQPPKEGGHVWHCLLGWAPSSWGCWSCALAVRRVPLSPDQITLWMIQKTRLYRWSPRNVPWCRVTHRSWVHPCDLQSFVPKAWPKSSSAAAVGFRGAQRGLEPPDQLSRLRGLSRRMQF